MGGPVRAVLRAGWAAVLAVTTLLAAVPAASAFTPEQDAELQRIVEDIREAVDYPGVVAGVWQEGNGGFTTAVGEGRLSPSRPLTVRDHFRIGSNTKTMTATLVLQLVERGRLHLQDSVSEFVRGVPFGRRITIRMLLNHTSGIADGPGNWANRKLKRNLRHNFRVPQLIRRALRDPRTGPPGERWSYSNTNYWLLGEIVREVTDKRLRTLYERRVFDRVGLKETSFHPRRPVPEPAAHGYIGGPGGAPLDVTDMNWSWAWTAGGVSSTLEDLRRWAPALATGRGLLDRRIQAKRLRTVATGITGPFVIDYGLGILEWKLPSGTFYGHDGEGPGYDSVAVYAPELGVTIVAFGNTSSSEDPIRPSPLDQLGIEGLVPLFAEVVAE
jgi:D-alanyl-D-alanine carboxypeptidase